MNATMAISPATSLLFTPHCPWCKTDLPPNQAMCFDCYYEHVEPSIVRVD